MDVRSKDGATALLLASGTAYSDVVDFLLGAGLYNHIHTYTMF